MSNGFYEGEGPHKNLYIYIMEKGGKLISSTADLDCVTLSTYFTTFLFLSYFFGNILLWIKWDEMVKTFRVQFTAYYSNNC